MTYILNAVPTERRLNTDKLIISVDTERKRLDIEGVIEDVYEGKDPEGSRKRIIVRGNRSSEFDDAMDEILPDDGTRAAFISRVMTYFAKAIGEENNEK